MNDVPPQELLDALNQNQNSIYVWVPVASGIQRRIRVSYPEAIDWVFAIARERFGEVPYVIAGGDEVYLGNLLQYDSL